MSSTWSPAQYNRFRGERQQPFFDLLGLVRPRPAMRVVDLGCGTGELTRVLHDRLGATATLGLDSSPTMLADSAQFVVAGLRFQTGDIAGFDARGATDLVFSNAALHWLPDHEALFTRLTTALAAGGQLAVQMPMNFDHPSHTVAAALAGDPPFAAALGGFAIERPVQAPEWYATLLHRLGYAEQHVRVQVYGHVLAARDDVVEWVKGTLLTAYQQRLPAELWPRFLERYRAALLPALDDSRPYFYPFKRLLLWGRRP
ncbi:MAG: methyltransferase domain-containing protein [Deltaproteobacteria bacterium]|nr:methyltransferase domain-containing protein [Deltaproteobacteria bacterium]